MSEPWHLPLSDDEYQYIMARRRIGSPVKAYEGELDTTRDIYFMQVALLTARRSTCERGHVGAVAVQDRRIVATGYNGAPPGSDHCTVVGCDLSAGVEQGCQRAVHAEANLVAWAARSGVPLLGAVVYATHSPCRTCAQALLSAGIRAYHFTYPYRAGRNDLLLAQGVFVMDHAEADYGIGKP